MAKQKEHKSAWVVAGLAFVGCCAIGSGLGQITDSTSGWSAIGAGAGFLLAALLLLRDNQ